MTDEDRYHRNQRAFNSGQWRYDNAAPPDDDGVSECENCCGTGKVLILDKVDGDYEDTCSVCKGKKFLDEDGNPVDYE